ncbi:MAG: hypothetical protein WKF69_04135, partial [Daejeonella sp.]
MRKKSLLPLIAFSIITGFVSAQNLTDRVPYRIYDNFDTGEMYTWEPYPYQQDTGYDPAFSTKKEPAYGNKGSALSRVTRPNDANDLAQGFTKRIDMYVTGSTRVKFAVFMMSDRKPEKIDVSLGIFDGTLYTHTITSPKANTWVEVDLLADAFSSKGKALKAGKHIQVVVMKASYPRVSHLLSYTILMDEFSINGERPRQFVSQSPKSTWFEQFGQAVIHKHFAPGETLSLSVAPEGGLKLNQVTADLRERSWLDVDNALTYNDIAALVKEIPDAKYMILEARITDTQQPTTTESVKILQNADVLFDTSRGSGASIKGPNSESMKYLLDTFG